MELMWVLVVVAVCCVIGDAIADMKCSDNRGGSVELPTDPDSRNPFIEDAG